MNLKILIEAFFGARDLPENKKLNLMTKFLDTFQHYNKIKGRYNYEETVKKLSKSNDIFLLKQDKGRGIVIMDQSKYDKCLQLLQTDKFVQLQEDQTG